MRRNHRRWHRLIWLLLAPVLAVSLWAALQLRPQDPVNDEVPSISETGDV